MPAHRRVLLAALLSLALLAPVAAGQGLTNSNVTGANICYRDLDNDNTYEIDEPVYFVRSGCGNLSAGDVRLTDPGFGSKVRSGDNDFSRATLSTPGRDVYYLDNDGNNVYNPGDSVYLKATTSTTNLAGGDIRLTAFFSHAAGTVVRSGNQDFGLPVTFLSNAVVGSDWKYFDSNGDNVLNGDDIIYIDVDVTDTVTVRDVRIPPATGGGGSTPPPSPPPAPPPTPPAAPPSQTEQQLAVLLQQNTQLAQQLNRTIAQNNDLQAQLADFNEQIASQNRQITQLNQQIADLQRENREIQQQITAGRPQASSPGFEALFLVAAVVAVGLVLRRKG